MQMSKLTAKYQTTIPSEVRAALGLKAGDKVAFDITDSGVMLRAGRDRLNEEQLEAIAQMHLMKDWNTPEDDAAFKDL
jgi:antitoxin PrlF